MLALIPPWEMLYTYQSDQAGELSIKDSMQLVKLASIKLSPRRMAVLRRGSSNRAARVMARAILLEHSALNSITTAQLLERVGRRLTPSKVPFRRWKSGPTTKFVNGVSACQLKLLVNADPP